MFCQGFNVRIIYSQNTHTHNRHWRKAVTSSDGTVTIKATSPPDFVHMLILMSVNLIKILHPHKSYPAAVMANETQLFSHPFP